MRGVGGLEDEVAVHVATQPRADRLEAQPRGRNSGSTFKNPTGHHAWELVDAVGLRDYRIGDALFSNRHCNFIENVGAVPSGPR